MYFTPIVRIVNAIIARGFIKNNYKINVIGYNFNLSTPWEYTCLVILIANYIMNLCATGLFQWRRNNVMRILRPAGGTQRNSELVCRRTGIVDFRGHSVRYRVSVCSHFRRNIVRLRRPQLASIKRCINNMQGRMQYDDTHTSVLLAT